MAWSTPEKAAAYMRDWRSRPENVERERAKSREYRRRRKAAAAAAVLETRTAEPEAFGGSPTEA